jgi:hypothetical protein
LWNLNIQTKATDNATTACKRSMMVSMGGFVGSVGLGVRARISVRLNGFY